MSPEDYEEHREHLRVRARTRLTPGRLGATRDRFCRGVYSPRANYIGTMNNWKEAGKLLGKMLADESQFDDDDVQTLLDLVPSRRKDGTTPSHSTSRASP